MKNKIQRFFEPSFEIQASFFRMHFKNIMIALFLIITIFFVKSFVWVLQKNDMELLQEIFYYFLWANILYFVLMIAIRNWWRSDFFFRHVKLLDTKIHDQFHQLDNTYVEKIGTGKTISILNKWIDTWTRFVIEISEVVSKVWIFFIFSIVMLWDLWWKFIFFFLFLIIFVHIIVYVLNESALFTRKARQKARIEHDRQAVKMIMSKFEILQNKKIHHEIEVLNSWNDEMEKANYQLHKYLFPMYVLPDIVFFIIVSWVLLVLFYLSVDFASILWIFLVLSMFSRTLSTSVDFFKNMTKDFHEVEHMWEFFDNAPKMDLQKEKPDFQYKKWDIEIQNITFSYDEKNPVFTKFSLVCAWSQKIAFVWASWWGKTTLVKLISGFIKSQSGNILIDWQKLSEISLESYYQNIWYLTQEPSVFDGSIEDNLLYGTFWEVSEKVIKKAIENAWCEFIYEFEYGLQTQIGERWVRLSWWQKQRLAIAKLFLKDPKIIILDEPTSALDSFSEEKITQSLHKLF